MRPAGKVPFSRVVENAANIAIVLSALVPLASWARAWTSTRKAGPLQASRLYNPGDVLPNLPGLTFREADRTLVLFINSNCQFCTASMPFYRELIERRNQAKASVAIVAATREPVERLATYLAAHGLIVDKRVALGESSPFRLTVTPAVLQVDSGGTVERLWIGKLERVNESEILTLVSNSTPEHPDEPGDTESRAVGRR